MKANTALSFLGAGAGLACVLQPFRHSKASSRLCAFVPLILGVLTLMEHLFALNLHIDQLILRDPFPGVDPGRMSRITAINFCLASTSIFFLNGGKLARRVSHAFGFVLSGLALTSIVGYIYGVPILYGSFRSSNSMALHTGIGFLILSFGIILASKDSMVVRLLSSSGPGGWLTRRAFPLVAMLPILLGYWYSHPAVNFGQLRFGMALFAVTLVMSGALAIFYIGTSLNRIESQQQELMQIRLDAAENVRISERELRLVTDNLPTLISYIDPDGRFLRVNHTYEQWSGRTTEQIIGRTVREVIGEDYWKRTRSLGELAEPGHTRSIETIYPTLNGDRRAIVTYAPDFDVHGDLRGFACMVSDVDDQRRAESALRESERLAFIGRLSSTIAHEINNPVDAAMNIVYLLREQSQDPESKTLLAAAENELKRVAKIANETLQFHRQSEGAEAALAADLFTSVINLQGSRLRKNGIDVKRRDRAPKPFLCREGEIRQVLNNLVANAIDATPAGGHLILRSQPATDWVSGRKGIALTIADTGTGMDQRTRNRVFEAFYSTKGKAGSGLGLWISSEILNRHQAHMRVRSSMRIESHGTVFRIFMPT